MVRTSLHVFEIPFCQAWVKSSIDGPSFWKTVRPSNHTLQTHFVGFLESAAGMGQIEVRIIFQTDAVVVGVTMVVERGKREEKGRDERDLFMERRLWRVCSGNQRRKSIEEVSLEDR
ncbi:hypothetical protein HAX54_033854 [Datura stramonium]|uniref:Uncharacterized protein n=1 Tax=Datura stramonium TaxID=4076 RepID=A0ABS8VE74_DATST|nr:hypothetical protein [Datura stramonium]